MKYIPIGAHYLGKGKCTFCVWGPTLHSVEIVYGTEQNIPLQKNEYGYWLGTGDKISPGVRYMVMLNKDVRRPDPASFFQPDGVHGPSAVVDHSSFKWKTELWKHSPLEDMIIYELHVGTFTAEGTFAGAITRLKDLKSLGITALEVMPVAQFPGTRNWGYDGVYFFAVQNSYGGPEGLKGLVDACHEQGIAVILDVVYNHLGPEGNYLEEYAPYCNDTYKTLWGKAINYDGPYSYGVRNFIIQNALYWFTHFRFDGLRLDAIHGIYDQSATHILAELSERIELLSKEHGRKYYLIAESDLNDARFIRPRAAGGYGLDAQWCDDFHHALHTMLTGETKGYYGDFGSLENVAAAFKEGVVYTGQYSAYRKKYFGNSFADRNADQCIVFSQNHDQVGNRKQGDRLATVVEFEGLKLAACAVFFSPFIPLLFMGEEYGEKNPFHYFVNHSDVDLIQAVRKGRQKEFASFAWEGEALDPQAEEPFLASRLHWSQRSRGEQAILLGFYQHIIGLRKRVLPLRKLSKKQCQVKILNPGKVLLAHRGVRKNRVVFIMNFSKEEEAISFPLAYQWKKIVDSADGKWSGPGSKIPASVTKKQTLTLRRLSCVVLERES